MKPSEKASVLRDVARLMEKRAQRIYNQRDRHHSDEHGYWLELNGAATALSRYGRTLMTRADELTRKPRGKGGGRKGR